MAGVSKKQYTNLRKLEATKPERVIGHLAVIAFNERKKRWETIVDGVKFAHFKRKKVQHSGKETLGIELIARLSLI